MPKEKKPIKKEDEKEGGKKTEIEEKQIIEKEDIPKKTDVKKENKILRNIFISIGIFVLILLIIFIIGRTATHFKYNGVKFNIERYGDLIVYHTSFPVVYNGTNATYNIYLRNDPRKLKEKVPAKGPLLSIEDTAINMTEDFKCGGAGIIAIENLRLLYAVLGKIVVNSTNTTCDDQGRYMVLNIMSGNSTRIEGIGPNCYNIYINNCEILEGTERFILGMLVKINREPPQ
jgi:hypothetical protein